MLLTAVLAVGAQTPPTTSPATRPTTLPAAIKYAAQLQAAGIKLDPDVSYLGPDRTEKMDIYRPQETSDHARPAVLIIHGGGWVGGTKSGGREFQAAEALCKAGYLCASIDYRLATKERPAWPGALEDCRDAVKFLRTYAEKFGIDPARIGVIGGSAGGHLSLMLGTAEPPHEGAPLPKVAGMADPNQSSQVSVIVDLYGPTDLISITRERMALIGFSRADRPDLYRAASPLLQLTADFPPTLIIHGTADKVVEFSQSEKLDAAMTRLKIRHEFVRAEGAPHAFLLKDADHDFRDQVVAFFDSVLKSAK